MADYTTNTGIIKPTAGEYPNTWGAKANVNFDIFDRALGGRATITKASGGANVYGVDYPVTLAVSDGALSDGQYPAIEYADDGDLGDDLYVQLTPADAKRTITFKNSLTNNRNLVVYQGEYNAGRAYTVANGYDATLVFSGGGSTAATVTALLNKPALTGAHTATLIDLIYPVGAVFVTTSVTNPGDSSVFGVGTWEIFGEDTVLRGISTTGTAGTTGGSDTVTIGTNNLPTLSLDASVSGTLNVSGTTNTTGAHAHSYQRRAYNSSGSTGSGGRADDSLENATTVSAGNHSHTVSGTASGTLTGSATATYANDALNVVPAYITVYMWKRIA